MVEGGAQLLGSFVAAGVLDELHLFVAPIILGAGKGFIGGYVAASLAEALRMRVHSSEMLGGDLHVELRRD